MATNATSIAVESSTSIPVGSSTLTSTFTSTVPSTPVTPTSTPPTSTTFTSTFSQSSQLTTSTVTASSVSPSTTALITSTVNLGSGSSTSLAPIIVTVTTTSATPSASGSGTGTSSSASTSSTGASLTNDGSNNSSSGLTPAGRTAIAVVIPVVVVALLVVLGLFLWRRRKQQKAAGEERRQEVEDYGYNPNNDPTIPVVASEGPDMSETNSGYRGWGAAGAAAAGSNRKASTTLSGGHTQQLSDGGSNAYGNSPHHSDGNSGTGLMDGRRQTMGSDDFTATPMNHGAAAAGVGMAAGAVAGNGMRRGPSNASSRYSGGAISNHSEEPVPQIPQSYENHGYGYTQHGPYGDGSYSGGANNGMPVVRDVSARRNTRVQQAGNYSQGNSGIAQNF